MAPSVGDDSGLVVGRDAGGGSLDAAPDASSGGGTDIDAELGPTDPGCDLSGVWIARQNTQSLALKAPQNANTWYYFELAQAGRAVTITRHFDCGIEVAGTVRVKLPVAATRALIGHNVQTGRKGVVRASGASECSFSMDPFWSVRGVSETKYTPTPRSSQMSLAELKSALPLPTVEQPELTEDWDGDQKSGITWYVNGIVNGERNTIQRDWTRYFTEPGYMIPAGNDFGDVLVRADFDAEEVIFGASIGLNQLSQPDGAAKHELTLRFLGRSKDDPRAVAIYGSDDFETCLNVQKALPPRDKLRAPETTP